MLASEWELKKNAGTAVQVAVNAGEGLVRTGNIRFQRQTATRWGTVSRRNTNDLGMIVG